MAAVDTGNAGAAQRRRASAQNAPAPVEPDEDDHDVESDSGEEDQPAQHPEGTHGPKSVLNCICDGPVYVHGPMHRCDRLIFPNCRP